MTPEADVYQGTALVAHLERTLGGIALKFLPDIELENGFLATSLSPPGFEGIDLAPFFLNLLPEGARLLLLLQASKSKDDSLELLLQLGWDAIGDVAVLPHGTSFAQHAASVQESKLEEVDFWELFYSGASKDATVPGVQEKISSSTIAFGVRTESAPSAILKLNPKNYPRLVQNEEFFLRMSLACGLETNRAHLVRDRNSNTGLLVTRFDRAKKGKSIRKLHQEDACQLLNTAPANKYKLPMRSIADAISTICTAPVVEIERLLLLYAFSYLIGNGDLHAKNISVLWQEAKRLSPVYDLLSTLPYGVDQHMALPLDGRNDNFRGGDFASFGKRFGVPEEATLGMIRDLCRRAEAWIGRVGEIGFDGKTTEKMQKEISTRMGKLLR